MSGQDLLKRTTQGIGIQRASDFPDIGQVVGCCLAFQLFEEPQSLLRKRQQRIIRIAIKTAVKTDRRTDGTGVFLTACDLNDRCEFPNRRRVEQPTHRDVYLEGGDYPRFDTSDEQRMPTQREKIIMNAH